MTFVALLIQDWPTGAAANDLLAQLLDIAPRAAVTPEKGVAWLDARGLDPVAMVERARAALQEIGVTKVFAGVANVPCVAEIVALSAAKGLRTQRDTNPEGPSPSLCSGSGRQYLAPLPLDVLQPEPRLLSLFLGIGLFTCGDLARLTRESVEVRLGREALVLWKLARADDLRPIFSARPRELPTASLDWTEFSTIDIEQLIFVLHSLLKTVCDQLATLGIGARTLELTLLLENRRTITQLVTAARSTSQRTTWLRLVRRALEKIELPDRVTGIAVRVDAAGPPTVRQGDFFDFGFASAQAAESAVGHILDLQGDAVVAMQQSEHPLPEHRVKWLADAEACPEPVEGSRVARAAQLSLLLLPVPREIDVVTERRRGFLVPARYTDNGIRYPLAECLGPQCVSGISWHEPMAREYHQGVRADGSVVLLYRDALAEHWYLAGWWD
ncbi:MAG TPA: hypothetical protein VGH75_05835 [Steroidobacteraceae bacterium]|jgi:protein ImuB